MRLHCWPYAIQLEASNNSKCLTGRIKLLRCLTHRVAGTVYAIGRGCPSVRLFVCLFPLYLLNRMTF